MNRIKELREKRGLTQEALADELGITRTAIAKWESGETNPRATLLRPLAVALKCNIDAIFLLAKET